MRASNENVAPTPSADGCAPLVVLQPTGDGIALYRALARILVRHELKFASAISDSTDCETLPAAG